MVHYMEFYQKYSGHREVQQHIQPSHYYYHHPANTRQPYLIIFLHCLSIFCLIEASQNCFYTLSTVPGIPEITHDKRKQHVACVLLHLHAYKIQVIVDVYYMQNISEEDLLQVGT